MEATLSPGSTPPLAEATRKPTRAGRHFMAGGRFPRTGLALVTMAWLLAGCGGGGGGGGTTASPSGGTLVGTFIDAAVSGLEFESATGSGITDGHGNFTYRDGERVTFRIGNLYLGSAVPKSGKVTPLDLIGTSDASDTKVVRILRTLQSMDADANPENGIDIPDSVRETLKRQERVDLDDDKTTDEHVTGLVGNYKMSENEAREHFERHKDDDSNEEHGYVPPVPPSPAPSGNYALVARNDLGMHCVDGKDYSVFSILPPYNNLHAHLISRSAANNKHVMQGVTLTYEAVADTTGSINTRSATKTNFWDWVLKLFGAQPAADRGLNLSDPGTSNPTPSLTPAAMTYNSVQGWWEAEGIPVTPYDDKGFKNYYPMVKVVAKDATGKVLASTKVVLPVSDEMSCKSCHASTSGNAAKPVAGWVNDVDPEKDWKKNILRLHDEKFPNAIATANMQASYTSGTLLATANAGQPVLCAGCHKSNALGTPAKAGIKPLTEALHARHASVRDPTGNMTLDDLSNRESCYLCHPGSQTKCLRGVMGNAKNANGGNAIDCQSCHGNMSKVGQAGREGWLDMPSCQNCHDQDASGSFVRHTSVFDSGGMPRATRDTRFASTANTPASGVSLYRFSKGHGNLQCEACHGSTHAEYPSSHANDNVQSLDLQGYIGTVTECAVCHATVPMTASGGPHGLHTLGQGWVVSHGHYAEHNATACATCHGKDYRGGILAKVSTTRTFSVKGGLKTYAAGQQVGCYDCHNGPNGD